MSHFAIPGLGWANASSFHQGLSTLIIPYHSLQKQNREKFLGVLKERHDIKGVILMKGGEQLSKYDTDGEPVFQQDSWFQYLFGVKEPGFFAAINLNNKGECILFIPRLPKEYEIWCGKVHPPEYFLKLYEVDEVLYVDELSLWLQTQLSITTTEPSSQIHILDGLNSDSGLSPVPISFPDDEKFKTQFNSSLLYSSLAISRVTKTTNEINLLRYIAWITSNAHVTVMRHAKPDMMEYQLEALFLYEIYSKGGCRHPAYTSICACGPNSAVLHYGHSGAPNNVRLHEGGLALLDMGASYHGYCADITCTFPISGRFSSSQRVIYEGVLQAQKAVFEMAKPGVAWTACHLAAQREILRALLKSGILTSHGDTDTSAEASRQGREGEEEEGALEELAALGLGAVFFPHGLGHLIGCDTHDVGGYIDGITPSRPTEPGLKNLRTARILEAGMVLTNEPGCYFIDYLLDEALANPNQAKHIHVERLNAFRHFGGVRLEDMFVVTETGVRNLTQCPRTVAEVESVMSGGPWPPVEDEAPYLFRQWGRLSEDRLHMVDIELPVLR